MFVDIISIILYVTYYNFQGLNERCDNNTLRIENQKIRTENSVLREMLTLNNTHCSACQRPTLGCEEERHISMQKLRMENALLLQQASELLRDNLLFINFC